MKVTSKSFTSSPPNSPWNQFLEAIQRGPIPHDLKVFLEFLSSEGYTSLPRNEARKPASLVYPPQKKNAGDDWKTRSFLFPFWDSNLFSGGKNLLLVSGGFGKHCMMCIYKKNPLTPRANGAIISNDHITRYGNDQHMGVSKNRGTPKSSNLIGFSLINHPFWGTSIFGNTHVIPQISSFWVLVYLKYLPS